MQTLLSGQAVPPQLGLGVDCDGAGAVRLAEVEVKVFLLVLCRFVLLKGFVDQGADVVVSASPIYPPIERS